jgi:hypothetical protein
VFWVGKGGIVDLSSSSSAMKRCGWTGGGAGTVRGPGRAGGALARERRRPHIVATREEVHAKRPIGEPADALDLAGDLLGREIGPRQQPEAAGVGDAPAGSGLDGLPSIEAWMAANSNASNQNHCHLVFKYVNCNAI